MIWKVLVVFGLSLSHCYAATPAFVERALNAYLKEGKESFLPAIVKGSPMEGEKSIIAQGNTLGQIEAFYGRPTDWEIVAQCQFTSRITTIYYVMNHERGPVYGFFNSFKNSLGQEFVTNFLFHTEPTQIFPAFPIARDNICAG